MNTEKQRPEVPAKMVISFNPRCVCNTRLYNTPYKKVGPVGPYQVMSNDGINRMPPILVKNLAYRASVASSLGFAGGSKIPEQILDLEPIVRS